MYKSLKADGFVKSRARSGYFVNPEVLADPGHGAAADGQFVIEDDYEAEVSSFVRRERCVTTC